MHKRTLHQLVNAQPAGNSVSRQQSVALPGVHCNPRPAPREARWCGMLAAARWPAEGTSPVPGLN